jgi:hypothetical protein
MRELNRWLAKNRLGLHRLHPPGNGWRAVRILSATKRTAVVKIHRVVGAKGLAGNLRSARSAWNSGR